MSQTVVLKFSEKSGRFFARHLEMGISKWLPLQLADIPGAIDFKIAAHEGCEYVYPIMKQGFTADSDHCQVVFRLACPYNFRVGWEN